MKRMILGLFLSFLVVSCGAPVEQGSNLDAWGYADGESEACKDVHGVFSKIKKGIVDFASNKIGKTNHNARYKTNYKPCGVTKNNLAQVHHAVEIQALDKYTKIKEADVYSIGNLRGIKKTKDDPKGTKIHQSIIRKRWNAFYKEFPEKDTPRETIYAFVKKIDDDLGKKFIPAIR